MLRVKIADRIQPQSNKFASGEENEALQVTQKLIVLNFSGKYRFFISQINVHSSFRKVQIFIWQSSPFSFREDYRFSVSKVQTFILQRTELIFIMQ